MILSILELHSRPGKTDDLVAMFGALDVWGHSHRSGGFLGARLLLPLEDGSPLVVIAEWEAVEAYQGWLDNPVRGTLAMELEPLLEAHPQSGRLYEVGL